MIDTNDSMVPPNNIRSLMQVVSDGFDARLASYRKGTRYESVRPSDVRVFVLALRQPRTLAELARILKISRQAVHASVNRLRTLKVVELVAEPGNKRNKLVVLTDRGQNARQAAQQQIELLEAEIAATIGADGLVQLRRLLEKLETALGMETVLLGP